MKDEKPQNPRFPEDVFSISTAVSSSLEKLDKTSFLRLNAAASLAESTMGSTIELLARANKLSCHSEFEALNETMKKNGTPCTK